MRKKVLLLAVSCKNGGLCPGGIDLDNPKNWIRIVKNDGNAGAVQGIDINFAKPLDVIEFDGHPIPLGKQLENWAIDNSSCKNRGRSNIGTTREILDWAYNNYSYHGFWNNSNSFLNELEFSRAKVPSESILEVSNVRIYKNEYDKAKIDFQWSLSKYPLIKWVSMTDPEFYNKNDVTINKAYIVISIPKECDWINPETGEKRAYKFVSKIFELND